MTDLSEIRPDNVTIVSSLGFEVAADLRRPPTHQATKGVVLFCHGFGGTKYRFLTHALAASGFIVLSIDFPGFGKTLPGSGRVLPSEWVHVLREYAEYARDHLGADRLPMVLAGATLGGAVAMSAAQDDPRFVALVLAHPIVNGEDRLRLRYPDEESWARFWERVEQADRDHETLHRSEIVFIPENLRHNLPLDTPNDFLPGYPKETVKIRSMDMLARIAPRRVLVVHAEDDTIIPASHVRALVDSAKSHCELYMLSEGDHFIFDKPEVIHRVTSWLLKILD